ncbi:MAG TPA: PilZ domain-containing protein, partial [Pyrinomonadaceae bacterium]|nr:PilZ domain-containing protein [Pyrinomonadaceae bacterium]
FTPSPFPFLLLENFMPEMVRSIVARMREYFGNRRRARRYRSRVPIRVSLYDPKLSREQLERAPYLEGTTSDISASGLALIVPAIRIGDRYLTAPDQLLRLLLDFPSDLVEIRVAPVRYEQLDRADGAASLSGYLIGVRIAEMSDTDRERFDSYLRELATQT